MYLWIKALHIVAVVTWFAALFYLPRLYVYHAMARDKGEQQAIDYFGVMERKLYRGIMTPSMIAVIALGAWLLYLMPQWLGMGWMHAKLALVLLLVAYHHVCLVYLKQFAAGRCRRSHVFFRWFNELPVVALLGIVILAVLKPF
ncbi:protoporphyrinogen oxidase HemJ [Billgrantia sp. LNSP4103-1]|uniref:protoporphyrinogen oxidase HemJ n=1 Tax=Billgrantia sp. LNSP4103-1 TaxID=3410266 RepID=UPI00403F79F0